jgi:hypothetical protein
MYLIEDIKLTIKLITQNRKIWLLSILSLLSTLLPSRQKYETIFLALIVFISLFGSLVISIIGHGGLILAVNKLYIAGGYNLKEIWSKSKGRSFRIIGIYIRLFPIILLFVVGNYFIYTKALSPNWIYLERFLGSFLIGPIIHFGFCGIVIHDKKALPALKSSVAIYTKMFQNVITINLVYELLNLIFLAVVYLILTLTSTNPILTKLLILDFSTIQDVLKLPIILWSNKLITIFTWPFFVLIMTIIYNRSSLSLEYEDSVSFENSG